MQYRRYLRNVFGKFVISTIITLDLMPEMETVIQY